MRKLKCLVLNYIKSPLVLPSTALPLLWLVVLISRIMCVFLVLWHSSFPSLLSFLPPPHWNCSTSTSTATATTTKSSSSWAHFYKSVTGPVKQNPFPLGGEVATVLPTTTVCTVFARCFTSATPFPPFVAANRLRTFSDFEKWFNLIGSLVLRPMESCIFCISRSKL